MALLTVDPQNPDPAIIASAARILRSGGLVAFPTETVYGLGANALDASAVAKIFEAKARPAWNPVIAHVASANDARALTTHWPDAATVLASAFWPGPLTLVLPKSDVVQDIVSAGLPAVAIRVPSHPVAQALLAQCGCPIAAPSANRFTELSPTTAAHVRQSLGTRVDMILDGGPSDVGIESTVVDLTSNTPVLLRPGIITRTSIADALSRAGLSPHVRSAADVRDATPRVSPGMVERHYAPRADVWLFERAELDQLSHGLAQEHAGRAAVLTLDWSTPLPAGARAIPMPNDPLAYARALYATLHQLDAEGVTIVAIEKPPDTDAWTGIRDRLSRAAH